jgi:hypothetical protein
MKNDLQNPKQEKKASGYAFFLNSFHNFNVGKIMLTFFLSLFLTGNLFAITSNYTVNVTTSTGSPLSGVEIRYNNFGSNYALIGTTDQNGNVSAYLANGTYNFKAIYNSSVAIKNATISGSSNQINFQTSLLTAVVKDCGDNSSISGVEIRYNNFGSNTISMGNTNNNGTLSFELFNGTYDIIAKTLLTNTTSTESVTLVSSGTTVEFNPTKVCFNFNGQVRFNNFGSNTIVFNCNTYLFPGTYGFKFGNVNSPMEQVQVSGCEFNPTVLRAFNESNEPMEGVSFNVSCGNSWQSSLGSTNSNGILVASVPSCMTKIRARISTNSETVLTKSELQNSNYLFTAQKVCIKLINSFGNAITDENATVKQGGNSFISLGNLNAEGKIFVNTFNQGKYEVRYNQTDEQKTETIVIGSGIQEIVFQTGKVVSGCGYDRYFSGTWVSFTSGSELMPQATLSFKKGANGTSVSVTVVAGQTVDLCNTNSYQINTNNNPNSSNFDNNPNSSNFDGISVFPNPSSDLLNITVAADDKSNVSFNIFDALTGKSVYNFSSIGSVNETIDVSSFSSGLYYIQINNGGKLNNQKFIVK